jgi:hypothetical protein
MRTGFWWKAPKEGDHYEDLHVNAKIILKYILEKYNGVVWAG